MNDHPIEGMMDTTLEKIKQMVDVSTIVGDPITSPDGTIIIPISKISYGFASGGSDFACKNQPEKACFGGGAGAGVSINPVAFLTMANGNVHLLQVDPYNSSADRIVGMVPDIVDKVSELVKGKKKKAQQAAEAACGCDPAAPSDCGCAANQDTSAQK